MKSLILAVLLLAMGLTLTGCGVGEVTDAQQKAKQKELQQVANEDTTHVKIPGRDR